MVWLKYFDTPGGDDCLFKVWYTARACAALGVSVAYADMMVKLQPTYYQILTRVAGHWIFPCFGMGATAAAVACSLANIREKDDMLNYVVGGFAGGSIWGAVYRNPVLGCTVGVLVAGAAAFAKLTHNEDWDQFPRVLRGPRPLGSLKHFDQDFTLMRDPKDYK